MWRQKRRAIIIAVFLMVIILIVFFKALPKLLPLATCNDGVRNQIESDIDCGGGCKNVCKSEYLPIVVDTVKVLETSTSTYKIFALLKNPNSDFRPTDIGYTLYLYDNVGNKTEYKNTVKVPYGQYIPILLSNYQAESISRANIVIDDYKMNRDGKDFSVILKDFKFENTATPKLQVFYTSPYRTDLLNQFVLYTILKDKNSNILAVEKTDIKGLLADKIENFYISFNSKFKVDVASVMLIPVLYE